MKDFFELRESANKDKFVVKYAMSKKGPIRTMPFHLLTYAKKFLADKEKEGYKGIISKNGKPVKESVELDEATAKIKTTMADKVSSGATRFGLKSTTSGGHVSISGPKGKLNDYLRAIIGKSSFGNASDITESVELDEAADFEKISNELLKHKKKGIEFEKAAAFARVMFMNSSLSVQDKAFMGLTKLLKDMDDLVKRTTITKILKDNGFRVKGGKLMREGLEESVQSVTNIKFDYGDTVPNNAKPSEIGSLKQDWNTDKMAVRSAVKSLGGLVTDSEAPSRSNKFVGKLSVGTRGDASKLSNGAIQKAVKSKGAEIQSNQFMKEFVELEEGVELIDENYRILATKGMGAETKNSINVGRDVDYYDPKNGDKRMGKITKMTKSGYVVKDEKDGKSRTFAFHDRAKAKALLAK